VPPGTAVIYWWTVEDADGNRAETPPAQVQFDDERYFWQSLSGDGVTIYWYEGGQDFVEEIVLTVQEALAQLAEEQPRAARERYEEYRTAADYQSRKLQADFWTTAFFLVYVPFSKIGHYLYYPFTRYYLGKTLGYRGVYPMVKSKRPEPIKAGS